MAQVDFIVAFLVVFTMITYSIFIVSATVSKDFNYFSTLEIKESQSSLSKQLFESLDNKSLITNFKKIQILFEEIGAYSHTESLEIAIKPTMTRIHVYNQSMNEITSSTVTSGGYSNVTFDLDFSSNQKKYVNIFYFGDNTDEIIYNNNIIQTNVTAKILSEEDVKVLSQDKCNYLNSLSYDDVRNNFGFVHRFRIDNYCVYGENPPFGADVVVKSIPIFVEKVDETIYPEYVILMVW